MCPVDLPPRYSPSSRLVGGRLLRMVSSLMLCTMRCRITSPAALIGTSFATPLLRPVARASTRVTRVLARADTTLEHVFKTIVTSAGDTCQDPVHSALAL